MKISSRDVKAQILITSDELHELQRFTYQMADAFGLGSRIDKYKGNRPISFYSWDFDCLFSVLELALEDPDEYPDKSRPGYKALNNLYTRLKNVYTNTFPDRDA
jgi:hypothetical protein